MDYFSADYSTARARFCDAVKTAGGRLDVLRLGASGPRGEPLTIDIGWFGSDRPQNVVIHSSGIHGVEGFAGSAIQLQLMSVAPRVARDTAIVLVHILNPYGMAWLRRCNENNVDLNRNFLGENERYEGMPEGYAEYDSFLNPASPPSNDLFAIRGLLLIARYGMPRLKEAIATGQYERPKGLFFGGKALQEGPRLYQDYLASHLGGAKRILALDVHTGLGKTGQDTLLVPPSQYERMRGFFGDRVAPMDAQRSVAYHFRGGVYEMLCRAFTASRLDFLGQEFGTRRPLSVLHALREENRWHHYGSGSIDHPSKYKLKETCCPSGKSWRQSVLKGGQEVFHRALDLLKE